MKLLSHRQYCTKATVHKRMFYLFGKYCFWPVFVLVWCFNFGISLVLNTIAVYCSSYVIVSHFFGQTCCHSQLSNWLVLNIKQLIFVVFFKFIYDLFFHSIKNTYKHEQLFMRIIIICLNKYERCVCFLKLFFSFAFAFVFVFA